MSGDRKFAEIMAGLPNRTELVGGHTRLYPGGALDEDGMPKPEYVCTVLSFSRKGFGFGEVTILADDKGQTYIDTESMKRETVKAILGQLVDGAITDWDQDPERHKRYNKIRRSYCGTQCTICHGSSEEQGAPASAALPRLTSDEEHQVIRERLEELQPRLEWMQRRAAQMGAERDLLVSRMYELWAQDRPRTFKNWVRLEIRRATRLLRQGLLWLRMRGGRRTNQAGEPSGQDEP